jgi:hypothetical protein
VSGIRGLTSSLVYLLAAVSILLGVQAAAITFDDGLVHVIDAGNSYPFESVFVADGPGPSITGLWLVDGGEILVTDYGLGAVFRVDPISGDRIVFSGCVDPPDMGQFCP